MKKRPIRKPAINLFGLPAAQYSQLQPIKLSIDMVTGAVGGELKGLKPGATKEDILDKINEIIARINASGEAK